MQIEINKLRISNITNHISKDICFKKGVNLITSSHNSVGKSVIMKSIYHSLGADSEFDTVFDEKNTLFEIEFLCKNALYKVMRYKDQFSILKNNKLVSFVNKGHRVDLSKFYKEEFGMATYLKNHDLKTELSPPAYLFIPYYLDQDKSWKAEQFPFSSRSMGQYSSVSKNDLYLYHLGLYGIDYGQIKSKTDSINKQIKILSEKRESLDSAYNIIKCKITSIKVIDQIDDLESTYRDVSNKINVLLNKQNVIQNKIYNLDKERLSNNIKIEENKKIISKLQNNNLHNSMIVVCPNCNEKFDLELKAELLSIYNINVLNAEIDSLLQKNKSIQGEINECKSSLISISKDIQNADDLSKKTKANYENYISYMTLKDLINVKLSEIKKINLDIHNAEQDLISCNNRINNIKIKTNEAKNDFCLNYSEYLASLGNDLFDPSKISAFKKVSLSGSQYVRSTLAMFFSFLKTKNKYNSSTFNWPLVIDSPKEGEQDNFNSEKILNFILDQPLESKQCIVATIDGDKFINPDILNKINIIKFTNEKGFIMNKSDYDIHSEEIDISLAYFNNNN